MFPDFRIYYKATVFTSMVLTQKQTHRSMEQDRSPEINPCSYGQLIYEKGGKNKQWKKVSWISGARKTGKLDVKEWN